MSTYETERIEFENAEGVMLAARLERPREVPRAFALFAHCFTCSKDVHAATRISRALTADGLAVLRFDFTGLGGSDGDFANTSFSSNVEDLVAAARFLASAHQAPRLLVGHSFGGAAVIAAAPLLPEVTAVATIAAPARPAHVGALLGDVADEARRSGTALAHIGGRPFPIRRQFLDDLESHRLEARMRDAQDKAFLFFHAPGDRVVGFEQAVALFDAAPPARSLVSLDDADHLLHREADATWVARVLAAWSRRYV